MNARFVPWRTQAPGGQFEANTKDLTDETPLEKLGLRLHEIHPRQDGLTLPTHITNKEVISLQEGRRVLRIGDEERTVSAGDLLCFPADPNVPHQLLNGGDEPLRHLCVPTMIKPEAITYPDSGKVGILGGESDERSFEGYFNASERYDYWDGEID